MDSSLKVSEAAAMLGISKSTLHRLESRGLVIPRYTPGGHRRYDTNQVLNLKKDLRSMGKVQLGASLTGVDFT